MSCQKKLLQQWKSSSCSHLCLDIRTAIEYKACHLRPSTNIPYDQLKKRMAELPPKQIPFALVSTLTTSERSISKVPIDQGEQWLRQQGWQPRYVFQPKQDPCFWPKAQMVDNDEPKVKKPWILFSPHELLKDHMELIVQALPGRDILDIGCGSGRDLTWLLLNQPTWRGTGVDHLAGAKERFASMTRSISNRVRFISAKVTADGTWKSSSDTHIAALKQQQYDIVITIRFFVRAFLPILPSLVKPGGLLIISHFVDLGNYQQPKKERRLRPEELNQFAKQMGLVVLVDRLEWIEDGIRPVQSMILQKLV